MTPEHRPKIIRFIKKATANDIGIGIGIGIELRDFEVLFTIPRKERPE